MQNYLGDGDQVTITAPAAVASGQPILVGSLFGICLNAAAIGQPVLLWIKGVYQLAKNSSDVWTLGQLIYWDNTALLATSTSAGNADLGIAGGRRGRAARDL